MPADTFLTPDNNASIGKPLGISLCVGIKEEKLIAGKIPQAGRSKLRDLKKRQKIKPCRVRARRQALNEAGLIRLMQVDGIGRPATYAATVDLLLGRSYVQSERGSGLVVSERGRAVLDFLLREYPDLFSLDFTRQMERLLDDIASRRTSFEKTVLFLQSILG